ncbi:MAG TPA: hypothetical protein VF755_16795, partial [Catenuloplanes sp.]
WRPGTPAVTPAELPRIDLGQVEVREGDAGVATYRLPVVVSGRGEGQVRVFATNPLTGVQASRLATVRPGTDHLDVPVSVAGNTRYGADLGVRVLVKASQPTVVGDYTGLLTVRDDDPLPALSVDPVATRATEGAALSWRLTLSAPTDVALRFRLTAVAPAAGPEVSTTDVDPNWVRGVFDTEPLPSRALSATQGSLLVEFPAGGTRADVVLPTAVDQVAEPDEHLLLQPRLPDGPPGQPTWPHLSGTVLGAP